MQRATKQSRAIEEALQNSMDPLSVPELLDRVRAAIPRLGLATLYRALQRLKRQGDVREIVLPESPPRFEYIRPVHRHYFRCDVCRRVFGLPGCGEDLDRQAPSDFRVRGHEVILFGECRECRDVAECAAPEKPPSSSRRPKDRPTRGKG